MAEQFLHRADVVALLQQVGVEGMTEGMARRLLGNVGAADGICHGPLEDGFMEKDAQRSATDTILQSRRREDRRTRATVRDPR